METTVIVDCGRHTTKYAVLSKRHRRTDCGIVPVKCIPTISEGLASRSISVRASDWNVMLSNVVSDEVVEEDEVSLLLLLDTLLPKREREAVLCTAFEHIGAKKTSLSYTAATALFAAGEASGLSIDIGYTSVRLSPIDDGIPTQSLATTVANVGSSFADADLHQSLAHLELSEDILAAVKSQYCWVGPSAPLLPEELSLPDGSCIPLHLNSEEANCCGRKLLYSTTAHVPDSLSYLYQKWKGSRPDVSHWARFGGAANTLGVGDVLADCLSTTLSGNSAKQLPVRSPLTAPVDGGSILAHLSSFKGMCITSEDYAEDGPERCTHMKLADRR